MKCLLLSLLVTASVPVLAACETTNWEKQLVDNFDLSATQARVYRLAFDSLAANLDLAGVRLEKPATEGDLGQVRTDLMSKFHLSQLRADSVVASMLLVRLAINETGIAPPNQECLGK